MPIPLLEARNWRMDLDELETRVSPKDQSGVINSPHNPTGGVLTQRRSRTHRRDGAKHDFIVIADEIYSRNFYLEGEYVSIAALPGMRERTIIVDGFSKAYAMTGWRLGYAIMPEALGEDGDAVQQQHVQLRRELRADGRHRRARPATNAGACA